MSTLPDRFCAICFSHGREGRLITNPHCGECGHPYCYTCLVGEVAGEEGDGWGCLRCGRVIKHVKRWQEVVEEETTVIEEKVDIPEELVQEEQETSQSEEIETSESDAGEVGVESSDEDNLFSRG